VAHSIKKRNRWTRPFASSATSRANAFQCYSGDQQIKAERVALDVATNILRLFGSDRAFYYAAAFGAGASEQVDKQGCPAAIKEAQSMIDKMKVLTTR